MMGYKPEDAAGNGAPDGGEQDAQRTIVGIKKGAHPSSGSKSREQAEEKPQLPPFQLSVTKPMAQDDADVRNHTGHVSRSNHQSAVAARHGILQPAGHGNCRQGQSVLLPKEEGGQAQQRTFQHQGNPVRSIWNQFPCPK